MKEIARLFLERKIGRRAFLSRFAEVGVAAPAASRLARSLSEPKSDPPGRIVENMTGGEVMAELLLEWNVPYIFGLGGFGGSRIPGRSRGPCRASFRDRSP